MVERVEILRDGASAVYGADAVSGVVNVILRDNFEGLTIEAVQGMSTRGDGEQTTVSAVMGGNFERGNLIASVEYRFQDEVPQRDRAWAFPAISSMSASSFNNGSFYSPGGFYSGSGGTVCTVPEALGGDETTLVGGTFASGDWADIFSGCPSFLSAASGNGRDFPTRYDYAFGQNIYNGSHLFGAAFYGTYDISDSITAFMEFQGNLRESDSRLDGNPGYFTVPATNPYVAAEGLGAGYMFVRPTTTVGPRNSTIQANTYRTVVGLQGDDLFGRFSWELSYLWTKLDSTVRTNSVFNPARFTIISSPGLCNAGAGPIGVLCDAALVADGKGSATTTTSDDALDVIRPGNWGQNEIAFVRQNALSQSVFETDNWFGSVSGELFNLPAGPIGFAVGAERREEAGFNKPDSVTEAGESIANQVFTTQGQFDVTEVFGEVNIPIVSGMQWAEDLSVNLQGRWFDYSNFGDDTVWKVGVNYQVTPDIRFRFNQGTAFRAPQVTDLFGGGVTSFDFYTDPCSTGNAAPTPEEINNCAADGLNPATYEQFAGQTKVLAGGNPNLSPETADTMSVGMALTPSFLPNFAATVDWWQIELENLVTRPTTDSIIDSCYSQPAGSAAADLGTCAGFFRNTVTGQPIGIINQLSNGTGAVRTDGLDWSMTYFWDQLGGVFTLSHEGTYIFENTFSPGQGGASDRGSIPQFKANAGLNFERNNWSVSWRTRIIGDMDDPRRNGFNVFNYDGPEAHIEHDIRGRYQWNNYGFLVGVNNVFDEEPPYIFGTGNNTDLFTYSAMGRYFFARVSADF
jgi:iron complex outermembrane receptor protein